MLAVRRAVSRGRAVPTAPAPPASAASSFAALLATAFGRRVRRFALACVLQRSRLLVAAFAAATLAFARLAVGGLPLAATFAAAIAVSARLG